MSKAPQDAEYRDLFRQLEQMRIPAVDGMHGTVMGGGLELALAYHYRIAAPHTRFSFPEVTLGIIPGAGGTQRMPRLIGVESTLEFVVGARPVDVAAAIALGFVDSEVSGDLRDATVAFTRRLVADRAGPRRTSDRAVRASIETPALLERFKARAPPVFQATCGGVGYRSCGCLALRCSMQI